MRKDDKRPAITLICFPIYLHLVRLHDLLDGLTNITQAHINSCKLGWKSVYTSLHIITGETEAVGTIRNVFCKLYSKIHRLSGDRVCGEQQSYVSELVP